MQFLTILFPVLPENFKSMKMFTVYVVLSSLILFDSYHVMLVLQLN